MAAGRLVLHHKRGEGGAIPTVIVHEGSVSLDPPGLALAPPIDASAKP